ncbi:hypothetical protein [Novosphingobium cyanobacteriorum]|uniref:Uncharacterized protein n=1 Tax=Novosphingobium cyanobacteriorum TaxID=3024215 RepID=A0ABT6CQJ7_9SPHN|nr:hypothetical protein [Novosphingobium cyanobacteriorum]MDF8335553.1 hypothetical protein [Novosphingobium cyanobacteriorum]
MKVWIDEWLLNFAKNIAYPVRILAQPPTQEIVGQITLNHGVKIGDKVTSFVTLALLERFLEVLINRGALSSPITLYNFPQSHWRPFRNFGFSAESSY